MNNKCEFEVLMSCMHQKDFSIAYKTKINSDLLIINQCDKEDYQEINENGYVWRMISTTERGSSKSRNMAMKNARGTICLLCDDDEQYKDSYRDIILQAFDRNPNASLFAFNVERINVSMKKKYYRIEVEKETSFYRNFASPMLAFRLADIKNNGIVFNEMFGSGAKWGPGEESMFQNDARKKGLCLFECPDVIAIQDYSNESKWFHGYTAEYFYNEGAFCGCCKTGVLYGFAYGVYESFIKLRKERELSPFRKMYWRYKGKRGWKKNVTYSQYVANGNKY